MPINHIEMLPEEVYLGLQVSRGLPGEDESIGGISRQGAKCDIVDVFYFSYTVLLWGRCGIDEEMDFPGIGYCSGEYKKCIQGSKW